MINISELNSFPAQDGGSLAMLKEWIQTASGWGQWLWRTSLPRRYRCSDEDHSS